MLIIDASYLPDSVPSGQSAHDTFSGAYSRPRPSAMSEAKSGSLPMIVLLSSDAKTVIGGEPAPRCATVSLPGCTGVKPLSFRARTASGMGSVWGRASTFFDVRSKVIPVPAAGADGVELPGALSL